MKGGIYRGRVTRKLSKKAIDFISSLPEDERIFEEDIDGTEAHEIMLHECGILLRDELRKILRVLEKIRGEKRSGRLKIDPSFEDIHEFLETRVIDELGMEIGGKLHAGRSRNDQVALDIRMRVRTELNELSGSLLSLLETLLRRAEENLDTPMILYTHTQHAQMGTFAHYLLAQADILLRDFDRLSECYRRVNLSPLGACALGGSSFGLDRARTASLLGFDGLVENSIDAVSSRDFALEVASALTILMSNLSRVAEDFILWSSSEFGYLELADEYSSTSSVMPQKKNPCTLELIRGRSGEAFGGLGNLFSMVKGLITGYSRDLQETKPPLWQCFDSARGSVEILTGALATLEVKRERMREAALGSYVAALDLSEGLTKEAGLSFREAHAVVGEVVKAALESGLKMRDVNDRMIKLAAKKVLGKRVEVSDPLMKKLVDPISSLRGRQTIGSPSPRETARMLKERRKVLRGKKGELTQRLRKLGAARIKLRETLKKYSRG